MKFDFSWACTWLASKFTIRTSLRNVAQHLNMSWARDETGSHWIRPLRMFVGIIKEERGPYIYADYCLSLSPPAREALFRGSRGWLYCGFIFTSHKNVPSPRRRSITFDFWLPTVRNVTIANSSNFSAPSPVKRDRAHESQTRNKKNVLYDVSIRGSNGIQLTLPTFRLRDKTSRRRYLKLSS